MIAASPSFILATVCTVGIDPAVAASEKHYIKQEQMWGLMTAVLFLFPPPLPTFVARAMHLNTEDRVQPNTSTLGSLYCGHCTGFGLSKGADAGHEYHARVYLS